MASLQAATTDEHPKSSRLPRVSASSNPIETLQSVTTYLTAQGVPSSTIIGDHAHAALYHQHSPVPFAAPTGVAAAFMNSLPPHAQNRTSLIHDHTVGVRFPVLSGGPELRSRYFPAIPERPPAACDPTTI